jgi:sterol desaturase/sphingolipid hydroxylase (fatty acid hydroxylase superfamily)
MEESSRDYELEIFQSLTIESTATQCNPNAALRTGRARPTIMTMLIDALVFGAGLFAWTLVEYVIHGVLGHAHRTFVSGLHEVHHRDPRAVFALGTWIPAAVVLVGAAAIFGAAAGVIFFGGIVAGFAAYEVVHYRIHFARPAFAIEERLRARHLAHHFREPDAIFGVTTRLWDVAFGTEPSADRMRELAQSGAAVAPLTGASNLGRIIRRVG